MWEDCVIFAGDDPHGHFDGPVLPRQEEVRRATRIGQARARHGLS
jgi:hypothetical protein